MMDLPAYYRQLIGFRLEADDGAYGSGEAFPTFTVQAPDGETLDVPLSRDPEGNGGGFAFIGPAAPEGRT